MKVVKKKREATRCAGEEMAKSARAREVKGAS
jgi:hypothetical protein